MASHENRIEKNITYKYPITRIMITSKSSLFFGAGKAVGNCV